MLRHCVMFTWNDGVADDVKDRIAAGLDELAGLPGVLDYRHGADAELGAGNWDYVVVGDFESVQAYQNYATDPGHLALIAELVKPSISARAAVQYRC